MNHGSKVRAGRGKGGWGACDGTLAYRALAALLLIGLQKGTDAVAIVTGDVTKRTVDGHFIMMMRETRTLQYPAPPKSSLQDVCIGEGDKQK